MCAAETLAVEGPYDLSLSIRVAGGFAPGAVGESGLFRRAVWAGDTPVLMEVRQVREDPPALEVKGGPEVAVGPLVPIAKWVLFGDLDLMPFYEQAREHRVLGSIIGRLRGLKPTRPPSLFEMAVTAVTEQQISTAAAYQIRSRLVNQFGARPRDVSEDPQPVAFPRPERLAEAPLEDLEDCGLSRRKAEYIRDLAVGVVQGHVDLDRLKQLPNDEARAHVQEWRGFGPWSADYILVRGLARPDVVPADDLGVRTVVGDYLGEGSRMTADEVRDALAPLEPHRGMAAFYMLAAAQLGFEGG